MTARQQLGPIVLDLLDFDAAVEELRRAPTAAERPVVVFTPNLQHGALLERSREFRQAYQRADLVLADGWPVAVAASWLGRTRARRVPGSDLLAALLSVADSDGSSVTVVGGAPGAEDRLRSRLAAKYPGISQLRVHSPWLESPHDPAAERLCAALSSDHARFLFFCLGSPKQELLAAALADRVQADVVLGVGAALDFLVGEQRRAPRWMRRLGLEWLHRVVGNPRRLLRRYAGSVVPFIRLVLRTRRQEH